MMTDSDLINKALGVARNLTYNEEPQGTAKQMLHELSHRLGRKSIRVHKKKDGYMMITLFGESRYMTWRESVLYRLLKVVPGIRQPDTTESGK